MKHSYHEKTEIEDTEFDFESLYFRRLSGESWEDICNDVGSCYKTLRRLLDDWCRKNNKATLPKVIRKNNIVDDPVFADHGKIKALRKAGWCIREIAIDAHCTEECVAAVLEGR